jgi:hypothetical protein
MDAIWKALGVGAITFAVFALLNLLSTYPLMWAMNYVIPQRFIVAVFGIPAMTFWKTYALAWVCRSLFQSTNIPSSKA